MKKLLYKILNKLETRIVFYPMRKYFDPIISELEGKVKKLSYKSSCKIPLEAWYIKNDTEKPVILYCHGQAEHIAYFQKPYQVLADNGYNVFAPEYRGHGNCKAKGIRPSEKGIYDDINSAVIYLKEKLGIDENNIVIWGRSMGGAIAAEIATRYNFRGVILESTFTNIQAVSEYIIDSGCRHAIFPFHRKLLFRLAKILPIRQKFDTASKMKRIKSPVLVAHSKPDTIVDYRMAIQNAKLAQNAKLFISEEGSHEHSDWVYDEVLEFLKTL